MSLIKNNILRQIERLIGSAPNPQVTVLEDDSVTQTLPIVPEIARRSLRPAQVGGWHEGVIDHIHAGAGQITEVFDPYNAGADAVAPYPAQVPDGFDLWLMRLTMFQFLGVTGLVEASVELLLAGALLGWGRDDAGDPVTQFGNPTIARFTDSIAGASSFDYCVDSGGAPMIHLGMRIPRRARFNTASETADAGGASYRFCFIMGIFAAGLGQDIAT